MKVAVIGSRDLQDLTALEVLDEIPRNCTEILSGGAKGVDELARQCAEYLKIPCREFLPEYERFGRGAPLRRNEQIIKQADMVLAFWDFASRGTRHTILACQRRGIPCKIVDIRKSPYQFLPRRIGVK